MSAAASTLAAYRPADERETADAERVRALLDAGGDPWSRAVPLHLTASAVIVHPPTGRVLLRWHERMRAWLQVGGHGDPGETDPVAIAVREGREETALGDLAPWPDATLRHLVVVPVPAGRDEPAHEHADLRYVLATGTPDAASPERETAPLRWLSLSQARELVTEANLLETLSRVERLLTESADEAC